MVQTKLFFVLLTYIGQVVSIIFPIPPKTNPTEVTTKPTLKMNIITESTVTVTKSRKVISFDSVENITEYNNITDQEMTNIIRAYKIGGVNVDILLSFEMLIKKYGRKFESHVVTTSDGYALTLFRIVGKGPPAFLMHGLLGSADDFIVAGPQNGLAYLLADINYDVWLGNARGTKYSRSHYTLFTSDPDYWNFSWHEIGVYDLPAMIDYVLRQTKHSSLKFIGYSQGVTAFFVMASKRPEFNKKVSIVIALAPVAFTTNVHSPIIKLMAPGAVSEEMLASSGSHEFKPDFKLKRLLKKIVCGTGKVAEVICSNLIVLIFGYDFHQLNVTNLPVVFGHMPSGASVKQFLHYGQGFKSGEFQQYDYGSLSNSVRYGALVPPKYSLKNITTPIWIFYGDSDWMSDAKDVELLKKKMRSIIDVYKVPFEGFNHLDFIMAKDVKKLVYDRVIKILYKF